MKQKVLKCRNKSPENCDAGVCFDCSDAAIELADFSPFSLDRKIIAFELGEFVIWQDSSSKAYFYIDAYERRIRAIKLIATRLNDPTPIQEPYEIAALDAQNASKIWFFRF